VLLFYLDPAYFFSPLTHEQHWHEYPRRNIKCERKHKQKNESCTLPLMSFRILNALVEGIKGSVPLRGLLH
jgi:hypothetical protein